MRHQSAMGRMAAPRATPEPAATPSAAETRATRRDTQPFAQRARAAGQALARRGDWPVVLIVLAALALNLYRLGTPSAWVDEAFSAELARLPVRNIWGAFTSSEPNMILYYLMLHGWLGLLGKLGIPFTEFAIRLPSALFAAASAAMVLVIGRRFVNRNAGLVGAGLYILSSWQLTYAQQARGYSLQLLLICIAWYALFAALRDGDGRRWPWWVAYSAASALAVYAQVFTLFVILAQAVVFGCLLFLRTTWRARARKGAAPMFLSLVSIGMLSIPMLLASRHSNTPGWLPSPEVTTILHKVLASGTTRGLTIVIFAVCVLVGVGLWAVSRLPVVARALRRSGMDVRLPLELPAALWPALVGLAGWLLVPAVTSFFVSQGSLRLFSSRYLVVIVPALCLLAGTAVVSLSWKWVRIGVIVVVLGASIVLLPHYYATAQIEDWRTPTRWIEAHYQPGDGIISFDNVQGTEFAVQFQLHADRAAFDYDASSPGYASLARYGTSDPYAYFGLALNPPAIQGYAALHTRFYYVTGRLSPASAVWTQQTRQWLDTHYHLVAEFSNSTATVSLYDTTAAP